MSDRERRGWVFAVGVLVVTCAGLTLVCVALAGALATTGG